jgi:hypothetical protein
MDPIEKLLRDFAVAFHIFPGFRNWVRTRAHELRKEGKPFEIVLIWGKRRFRVGKLPHGNPHFAIEHRDGTIEQSPYA